MPGVVVIDRAWLATRYDRRCVGRRGPAPYGDAPPLRRLRRAHQTGDANLLGSSGAQSIQRAGVLRQSTRQLGVYPDRIVIVAEGHAICEHRRAFVRSHDRQSQTIYDWRHYLAVVQRKPGALRNGAPFAEMPTTFRSLQQHLLKTPGGDREMVEILSLVLQHDEQVVLTAVELACKAGVPTKTHILNLLHRLIDGTPLTSPTIDAPQVLTLTTEPQANVERYDALRRAREVRHAS